MTELSLSSATWLSRAIWSKAASALADLSSASPLSDLSSALSTGSALTSAASGATTATGSIGFVSTFSTEMPSTTVGATSGS